MRTLNFYTIVYSVTEKQYADDGAVDEKVWEWHLRHVDTNGAMVVEQFNSEAPSTAPPPASAEKPKPKSNQLTCDIDPPNPRWTNAAVREV